MMREFGCQVRISCPEPPQMPDSEINCKIVCMVRGFVYSDRLPHSSQCAAWFATNGAHDPNEKSPNHTHYFTFSLRISHLWLYGAGDTYLPTGIQTAAVPYQSTPASLHIITYPCRMGQSLRINSPCDTNPLRHTNYITYPPVTSIQNLLLGSLSNPKKCHLGIKVAESAIPHRIFWLL